MDSDSEIYFKWSNSCRLCLATEATIDIFAGESSTEIVEKIQSFLNVLIYDGDPLPQKLCSGCWEHLESWKKFREKCLEVEAGLKRKLVPYRRIEFVQEYFDRYAQFVAGDVVSSSSKVVDSVQLGDDNSTISTSDTSVQELQNTNNEKPEMADSTVLVVNIKKEPGEPKSNSYRLIDAIANCDETKETSQKCKKCKNVIDEISDVHVCQIVPIPVYNFRRNSRVETPPETQGPESEELDLAVKPIYEQRKKVQLTPWKCEPCNLYFKSRHALYLHHDSTTCLGNELDGFRCNVCARLFFSESDLAQHQVVHLRIAHHLLDGDLLMCKRCPMKFSDQARLKVHQVKHIVKMKMKPVQKPSSPPANPKKYECKICGEIFSHAQTFSGHHHKHFKRRSQSSSTVDKYHLCTICNTTFSTDDDLYDHRFVNHGMPDERKKCDQCGKKFKEERFLKKHITIVHSRNREAIGGSLTSSVSTTVRCNRCGRRFNSMDELHKHEALKHKNPTPFACRRCGMRFSARSHLLLHLRSHLSASDPQFRFEESHVKCVVCNTLFARAEDLEAHAKTHDGVNTASIRDSDEAAAAAKDAASKSGRRWARFQCSLCQQIFCKSTSIFRHANLAHPGQKAYIRRLKKPILLHGLRPLKCQRCDMWLPSHRARLAHVKSAHGIVESATSNKTVPITIEKPPANNPPLKPETSKPLIRVKTDLMKEDTSFWTPCAYCRKNIKNTYMASHIRRKHRGEEPRPAEEEPINGPFQCSFCLKILSTWFHKQAHERIHDPNRAKDKICPHCAKVFDSVIKCLRHSRACPMRMRVSNRSLQPHVKSEASEDINFGSVNEVTADNEVNITDVPLYDDDVEFEQKPTERVCNVCGKTYETANLLELHMMTAHGSMMFEGVPGPSQVGVSASPPREITIVSSKSGVYDTRDHSHRPVELWKEETNKIIRKINGEPQCTLCNIRFPNLQAATWHQRKHPRGNIYIVQVNERCYQCTICNGMMDSREVALAHISVHATGAQRLHSQHSRLAAALTSASNQVMHASSSTTSVPPPVTPLNFSCPFCPSAFTTLDSIRSHIFYMHPQGN